MLLLIYFELSSSPIVYFRWLAVGRHLEIGVFQWVGHVFSILQIRKVGPLGNFQHRITAKKLKETLAWQFNFCMINLMH